METLPHRERAMPKLLANTNLFVNICLGPRCAPGSFTDVLQKNPRCAAAHGRPLLRLRSSADVELCTR